MPRTSTTGRPSSVSPDTSAAAPASWSAIGISVAFSSRPKRSTAPDLSISGSSPATPTATPTLPRRHGRPWVSLITTPIGSPNARDERVADRPRRCVGVERHEQRGVLAAVGVRPVDRRVGRREAEPVAHDEHAGHRAHDARRLREHQLDELRLLVGARRELAGLGRRHHGPEVDEAALGLRHDLAGDDDHVARVGDASAGAHRVDEQRRGGRRPVAPAGSRGPLPTTHDSALPQRTTRLR